MTNFSFLILYTMSVNKVILIGNVGKDPDVRYLENNVRVANFPLATTERGYTMSNGTQVPDRTEWHTIVVWRGLAEVAEKYVRKGARLYIEGKIKSRTYEDKMGNRRYITEIYAEDSAGDEKHVIDADACIDCGACAGACPVDAPKEG